MHLHDAATVVGFGLTAAGFGLALFQEATLATALAGAAAGGASLLFAVRPSRG